MVPQNLHYLTDKLPLPNYDPIKTRLSNKCDYLTHQNHDNSNDEGQGWDASRNKLPGILQGLQSSNKNIPKLNNLSHNQGQNHASNLPRPSQQSAIRDKEVSQKQNYKYESQLKKYNDILNNNKQKRMNQAQVHNKNSKAESTQVNDYLKIYGIGKSGPQQQKNISKNSLKMKLDPIGGKLQGMDGGKPQGMELPKILSGAGGR